MTERKECSGHCCYKVGGKQAELILCDKCGRIRCIRNKDGLWENLY
jgi:hypothetical protein